MKSRFFIFAAIVTGLCLHLPLPPPGAAYAGEDNRIVLVYTGNILGHIDEEVG